MSAAVARAVRHAPARSRCCCSSPGAAWSRWTRPTCSSTCASARSSCTTTPSRGPTCCRSRIPTYRDVNLAWLFQIVLALAHRAGGIPGTLLLKTAFVLGDDGRPVSRRAPARARTRRPPRWRSRSPPGRPSRASSNGPHLVTFLGLALTLLALERAESGRPRALYALVPCGLVWANANSCFFLAPLVLALYALGARLDGRRADARRAALCAARARSADLRDAVGRARARLHREPLAHARAASAGGVRPGALARQRARRVRRGGRRSSRAILPGRRWRHLLPGRAAGPGLGARRNRFLAEFALLSGADCRRARSPTPSPRATARVTAALRAGSAASRRSASSRCSPARRSCRASTPCGAASRAFDIGLDPDAGPAGRDRVRDDNGLRDRMYNDMEVGSYLTWEGWPRHRVFQDPRINGYPPAFHALLRRDDLSRAEWDALLGRLRRRDRAGHLPRREPARRVLRSRSLGAGLPRRRRPGVRPAPARVRGAGRAGRAARYASSSIARPASRRWPSTRAPPDRRSPNANGSGGSAISSPRRRTTGARWPPIRPRTPPGAASTTSPG